MLLDDGTQLRLGDAETLGSRAESVVAGSRLHLLVEFLDEEVDSTSIVDLDDATALCLAELQHDLAFLDGGTLLGDVHGLQHIERFVCCVVVQTNLLASCRNFLRHGSLLFLKKLVDSEDYGFSTACCRSHMLLKISTSLSVPSTSLREPPEKLPSARLLNLAAASSARIMILSPSSSEVGHSGLVRQRTARRLSVEHDLVSFGG